MSDTGHRRLPGQDHSAGQVREEHEKRIQVSKQRKDMHAVSIKGPGGIHRLGLDRMMWIPLLFPRALSALYHCGGVVLCVVQRVSPSTGQ